MSGPSQFELTLNFIRNRRLAYAHTFNKASPSAEFVLKDLAKFCRATESCFNADPRTHALLEGRREVWNRITKHLNLTDEELFAILK